MWFSSLRQCLQCDNMAQINFIQCMYTGNVAFLINEPACLSPPSFPSDPLSASDGFRQHSHTRVPALRISYLGILDTQVSLAVSSTYPCQMLVRWSLTLFTAGVTIWCTDQCWSCMINSLSWQWSMIIVYDQQLIIAVINDHSVWSTVDHGNDQWS